MSLSIYTNVASLNAQRNVANSQAMMQTSMARLSSGLRVNSARDDAAGLAIATRMDAQVRGMNVAVRNAADAISLSQTAESGIGQATDVLQRMRELAVQAANGVNSSGDLANIDTEYQALNSEVTRIFSATEFNGLEVLGADAGAITFQVGANNTADNQITITTTALTGSAPAGALTTVAGAQAAIDAIDTAIDTLTTERANYGAIQSRFESAINVLRSSSENQAAAQGRIMDADFAAETANLTKTQILQQAGVAMIAQANQAPQNVMRLLQ